MGEFATYRGEEIKVGTCEDMLYLRADQRHLVSGYTFNLETDRFRFPFPDEDDIEPGQFHDSDRSLRIDREWQLPAEFDDHGSVQFTSRAGYVLSIPCPEQFGQPGMSVDVPIGEGTLHVGRNGFDGGAGVIQQAFRNGHLATIVCCRACRSKWSLTPEHAAELAEAFRASARAEANGHIGYRNGDEIARRIMAGYEQAVPA